MTFSPSYLACLIFFLTLSGILERFWQFAEIGSLAFYCILLGVQLIVFLQVYYKQSKKQTEVDPLLPR